MTFRTARISVGVILAIVFLGLVGLMSFMALDAFLGDLPGYPIFYFSCIALVVCSIRLAMGGAYGPISVQCAAATAMVGVLLDRKDLHDRGFWALFVTPLFVAVIASQFIKVFARKMELGSGETA